ncbi:response regulator transcription factor [Bradyrhizobium sp.]|uniref:response regulator transcription factor n=1 Tax=Bradyrhizobium sp. TaxID=376 RepID=UPI003C77CC45
MSDKQIVHVIDDDRAILTSTAGFLTAKRFVVQTYTSALDFLEKIGPHAAGCVVTDVRMPGISGIELMSKLRERGLALPIIIVTAHADILLAVEAMKRGAVDLLEKPFKNGDLVRAIRQALVHQNEETAVDPNTEKIRTRLSSLTGEEKAVLARLLKGAPNKLIADELGLSIRIFETYRATVMSKMKVAGIAELVSISRNLETAD